MQEIQEIQDSQEIEMIDVEDVSQDDIEETLREANKFIGLMEAFNISADGMEENLVKQKQTILNEMKIIDDIPDELNNSIIATEELLGDFILVRQSLRDDINATRVLLGKLSSDMSASHSDDLSGSMVLAYAELKKGNVASMKLLMESYSSVAETQIKVKKLVSEIKSIEDKESGTVNIQNNYIGSTTDILNKLKKGY